jgi:hypothetical protein
MAFSICISTIFKSIPKIDIHECMEKHLGKVSRIDCVDLNQNNRRVFVHFSEWYSNKGKGCSDIVLHQLETNGFCHFYIPNNKNKKNPDFYAKLLINKNPISHAEYKVKQFKTQMNYWITTSHYLQDKIDLLEETIQTMQLTIKYISERNQSLSQLNKLYTDADYFSTSMDVSELN